MNTNNSGLTLVDWLYAAGFASLVDDWQADVDPAEVLASAQRRKDASDTAFDALVEQAKVRT